MIRKLLERLLLRILKPDLTALTRQQLKGIDLDVSYLDKMSESERKEFYSQAESVYQNKEFHLDFDFLEFWIYLCTL